ncbi:MAG: hypothetical protein JNJ57_09470 [Saprospiraceae bacterium]|nr:hypothetical protein [Saprospiraceae bacterium]
MIKELTELVTLSEQALPNADESLAFFSRNNRDVARLYHAIQINHFRSEAEAIQKANVGERTKFRQVAKELLRCLEQMVLYLDFEKHNFDALNHSRVKGFQLTAIAKSLSPLACKNSARKAAEELLQNGLEYGRPEFVVEAAKVLMDFVSVAGDDLKTFEIYHSYYEQYTQWRTLEERSVIYFDKIKLPCIKRKTVQKAWAAQAAAYIEDLDPHVGQINSHHFHLSYFSLKSYRYTLEADYQEASEVHDAAIRYFSTRTYPCNQALNIFHYLEIVNCFYLGNYLRGNRFFTKALELAIPGTYNWFSTLELGFYLLMHQGEYVQAAQVFQMAVKNKKMAVLRETQRETWQILGAYLYIIQQLTGSLIAEDMAPKMKSSRFRNEIKDFSRDKQGMNIAILAAEVLLEFVEGKQDALWDRVAALEKYRERYLRNHDDTHRSQLFIKILVILSRHTYDGEKFLEKSKPYVVELKKSPLQFTNQAHELEIVPYEALVGLIADALNGKRNPAVTEKLNIHQNQSLRVSA